MSQPVNLKTANFLQLKTIKGFGDKKVEAIIKKRDETGGQLTIEDLEKISEIHTSVWPGLFDSGIITLEPSETEQAQGKEDQEMTLRTLGFYKEKIEQEKKRKCWLGT